MKIESESGSSDKFYPVIWLRHVYSNNCATRTAATNDHYGSSMKTKTPVTIYHNPRCSKSRHTLSILNSRTDCQIEVIEYLKTPPSADQLQAILAMLGMKPGELIRRKEAPFRAKNLDSEGLSDDDLIAEMIENPILIERPIVVSNEKAIIGRPPDRVLEIL